MTAIRIRAVKKKICMAYYRGNLLKTWMHTGIKSIVMYVRQKDRMRVWIKVEKNTCLIAFAHQQNAI